MYINNFGGKRPFSYDASGQRVKTVEPGGKTTYFPFPNYEEAVVGSSTIRRSSYMLAGQVVAFRVAGDPVTTNNGLFFIYGDHLGSTTMLGTSGGAFVAGSLARYRPYGSYRTAPTQTITDRDFTGQKENREIGLVYYNARFYVPSIGRFASADTIVPSPANPQSYNRYSYSSNNPIKYFDPSGHCASTGLPDGSFTRSSDDAACWDQYDNLVNRFTNAGHSAQWILNRIGSGAGYKYKDMSIVRVQDTYVNCGRDFDCSNNKTPIRNSDPYSDPCAWQSWDNCYEDMGLEKEIIPDAFVAGASADVGGAFGGYTSGAEDLFMRTDSGIEVEAFLYKGPSLKGKGLSADVGAYGGAVWNLDCIDCYSGPFWVLSVDASALLGIEFSVFGAPGAIPFWNDKTWGVAMPLAPSVGFGTSVSIYDVNYERH